MKKKKPLRKATEERFARFNLYTQMAHFVGKVLHIRPNEILDTWGVPELIVAYGQYANEISEQNYNEYRHLDARARGQVEKPEQYIVEFYDLEEQ